MSPEVINNNFKCGIYSDFWAVGCVLYSMVYGFPPFNDKTEYLVFQNILNLNFRFPSNKTVPWEIKDFIKSLLKLNPLERLGANGNLQALKNHTFFNCFNANSIDDDLKNAYCAMRNRRYSIDFKDINKATSENNNKNKSPSVKKKLFTAAKFKKAEKDNFACNQEKVSKGFNNDEPVITSIIAKIEDDEGFDENDYFEDLNQFEIENVSYHNNYNQEEFLPIEEIQEKKAKNYSDKELTLKFELSNQYQISGKNDSQYVN